MNMIKGIRHALCGLTALLPCWVLAHEDLDLAIAQAQMLPSCHVQIQLKNVGHDLPDAFYTTVTPAYLMLEKGEQKERLRSLRALDKLRALQPLGGELTVVSKKVYASIPPALTVSLHYAEEFGDYGSGNNRWQAPMDCQLGKGFIPGEEIVDQQPDAAVVDAAIDRDLCELVITLKNLSAIPLNDASWGEQSGAYLMRQNLDDQTRAPDIPLSELDAAKTFGTVKGAPLAWRGPIPFPSANRLRVGLWRVLDDRDFSNNTATLAVPNACIQEVP